LNAGGSHANVFDYAKEMIKGQHAIVTAEANSGNWLAASWRPITMLRFLALVVGDISRLFASP
jgi:hypothetical protein